MPTIAEKPDVVEPIVITPLQQPTAGYDPGFEEDPDDENDPYDPFERDPEGI